MKLEHNEKRDKQFQEQLTNIGWKVLVIWQCETKDINKLAIELERFLHENNKTT